MQRDGQSFEFRRLAALGWHAEDFPRTPEGVRLTDESVSVNYPAAGLTALGFEGEASYWFDHRAKAVIDALAGTTTAKSIWDVGAGTGAMSLRLASAGFEVVAVEPLIEGGRAIMALGCCSVFSGSLAGLKLPSRSIRLIGLFDVIEHLDDPAGILIEVSRILEPSGVVVITVPAFQTLWSNADVVAGHRRRYTTHRLDRLMNELGFTRVLSRYLFASLLPAAAVLRALPYRFGRRSSTEQEIASASKALNPSPAVDRVIRALLSLETALSRRVRLPAGLTVIGVYRTSS
jgi:2-polyprenyl-3-methyl-5-hydroxy-6-metoxy-1,4-benzoquinol methylase